MATNYTILVNSSDSFDDCWVPFFSLFGQYWQGAYPEGGILLNTETKSFCFEKLPLRATQVGLGPGGKRLAWSDCTQLALSQVTTPFVLYMQEDYFLERPVRVAEIEAFLDVMTAQPAIRHLALTHFSCYPPLPSTADERFSEIPQKSLYRVSCQAGLWRTDTLKSYLLPGENGWMFETFATMRAWRRPDERFLAVNPERYHPLTGTQIMGYQHTGVIKGKWHPAMPALFERHGLTVDFGKRGFHHFDRQTPLRNKIRTLRRLLTNPWTTLRSLRSLF